MAIVGSPTLVWLYKKAPLSKGAVVNLESLDFVDGKTSPLRYDVQRNTVIAETLGHGLLLFQRFGCFFFSYFFLSFMKFVFQSHILVPRESVCFEKGHLIVDCFGLAGVCAYSIVKTQERNIQTKIAKNAIPLHFAINCLQGRYYFYKKQPVVYSNVDYGGEAA